MSFQNKKLHCARRIKHPEQIGFAWGYEVSVQNLYEISGRAESEWRKIIGNKRAFYVDELGVVKNHRRQGIGETLNERLLTHVKNLDISYTILRTDVRAVAAKNLYQKFNFRELAIIDAQYPERTYWLKKVM
ncbi:MAG: GNAT family N-acetyltransferase [Patescibacteria group bacterium]